MNGKHDRALTESIAKETETSIERVQEACDQEFSALAANARIEFPRSASWPPFDVLRRTEADCANRAKSTFVAAASHDLRQSL